MATVGLVAACGSSRSEDDDGFTSGSNSGAGAQSSGSGLGGGFNPTSSGGAGGGSQSCETISEMAEPKTLDMYVLLDKSGSMLGSRWTNATSALTSFFSDPSSQGIFASLVFFGNPGILSPDDPVQCNAASYNPNNPPHVALGELPGHATALTNGLAAQTPVGYTPTLYALRGVVPEAIARQTANPDHQVVVVFVTDGIPEGCSGMNDTNIYAEAANSSAAGVPVYAIAITGADVNWLNGLASAGGTNAAIDVTSDITQFQAAMEAIRDANLGCNFDIPDPSSGEFDKDEVNVTIEYMGQEITLTRVSSAADCANNMSWYYDDNNNPTEIILCGDPCSQYGTNQQASISIEFGCPTNIQ